MLLDENPLIELTDEDATNLTRLLFASTRKAVGERIVPASDNRKQYHNKAQKVSKFSFLFLILILLGTYKDLVSILYMSLHYSYDDFLRIVLSLISNSQFVKYQEIFESNRRDITVAMMKNYPLLLRKFMADKAKIPSLVEIVLNMNLELYSLKRQEQVNDKVSCLWQL